MSNAALIAAAHRHLGRPWNPHGFDCWECVRAIYWDAFGIQLATYGDHQEPITARRTIMEEAASGRWSEIAAPVDGCVVLMGKRAWPHHIGVYLDADGGRIVHCLEHIGCIIDPVRSLSNAGWGFMKFYQRADAP